MEVDRGQIKQVLLDLYLNAWQAMPTGGELSVGTANVHLSEAEARAMVARALFRSRSTWRCSPKK